MREGWRRVRTVRWADRLRGKFSSSLPISFPVLFIFTSFFVSIVHSPPHPFLNDFRTGTSIILETIKGEIAEILRMMTRVCVYFCVYGAEAVPQALLPPESMGNYVVAAVLYMSPCKHTWVQAECRAEVKCAPSTEGREIYYRRVRGVMPTESEIKHPYTLHERIVIPWKAQLTVSLDYTHHCVLILSHPLHSSKFIGDECHQPVCHSACLFICLFFGPQ